MGLSARMLSLGGSASKWSVRRRLYGFATDTTVCCLCDARVRAARSGTRGTPLELSRRRRSEALGRARQGLRHLPSGAPAVAESGYYTFIGSLTTPPCTEHVTWFVLKAPEPISQRQADAFGRIYPSDARPTQPLNGRARADVTVAAAVSIANRVRPSASRPRHTPAARYLRADGTGRGRGGPRPRAGCAVLYLAG